MKKNILVLLTSATLVATAVVPTAVVLTLPNNSESTSVNENTNTSNTLSNNNTNNVLSLSSAGKNMNAHDFANLLSLCQEYGTTSTSNPFTESLYSYFEINNQPLSPNVLISAKLVNNNALDVNVTNPNTGFVNNFVLALNNSQATAPVQSNLNISAKNPLKLFAFGDSITAGFNSEYGFSNPGYYNSQTKTLAGISYPAFLAQDVQRINPAYLNTYQNYALSGSTVENWMYILGQAIAKNNNTTNPYTQYFSSTMLNFGFDNQMASTSANPENGRIPANFGTDYNSPNASYSNVYNQISAANMITFSLGANDLLDKNFFMNLVGLILSFSTSSFEQNFQAFEASYAKIQTDITSHLQVVLKQLRTINPYAMITAISYPSPLLRLNEAVTQAIAANSNNEVSNFATQILDQLDSSIENAISDFNQNNSNVKPINYVNIFNRSYWQQNSSKLSQGLFDVHPTTYGYKKMAQSLLLKLIVPNFSSYQTIQNLFPDWSENFYNDNIINEGITFGDGTTAVPLATLINDIQYIDINGTKTLNVYTDGPMIQNYSKYKLSSFGQFMQSYITNAYPNLGADLAAKLIDWVDSKTTDVTIQNAFQNLLTSANMQTSFDTLFQSNFIENFVNNLQTYFANNNNITESDLVNGLLNSLNINSVLDVVKAFLGNPAFSTPANLANIKIVMNFVLSMTLTNPSLNQKISNFISSFLGSKMTGSGISQTELETIISSFLSSPYTNQLITNIVVDSFENGQALAQTQTLQQFIGLVLQSSASQTNILTILKAVFSNSALVGQANTTNIQAILGALFSFVNGDTSLQNTIVSYISNLLQTSFLSQSASWKAANITSTALNSYLKDLITSTNMQNAIINIVETVFDNTDAINTALSQTTLTGFIETILKSGFNSQNILSLFKTLLADPTLNTTVNTSIFTNLIDAVIGDFSTNEALRLEVSNSLGSLLANTLDSKSITAADLSSILNAALANADLVPLINQIIGVALSNSTTLQKQTTIAGFLDTITSKLVFSTTNSTTSVTTQTSVANNIQSLIDSILGSDGFVNIINNALSLQNTTTTQNGYISAFFTDLFNQYWTNSGFQQLTIFTYLQDNIFSIIMSGDFSSILTEIQSSLTSDPFGASGIISGLFTPLTQVSGSIFGNFINVLFTNTPQNAGIYKFFQNLPTSLKSLPRSQMQEAYSFGALDSVFQGIATVVQNEYLASLSYSKTNPTISQNDNPYYQSAKRTLITSLIIVRFISGQTNFTNTSSGTGWFGGTNYLAYLVSLFPTNSNSVISPIVNDILGTSTGVLTGDITSASPIIQDIYNLFSGDNGSTNPTSENETAMNSIIAFLN